MTALIFDIDGITGRMMVDFKAKTGRSILALVDDGLDLSSLDEELVVGVVWLALRMSGNPDATWDDALDTPVSALTSEATDDDPTNADNAPS